MVTLPDIEEALRNQIPFEILMQDGTGYEVEHADQIPMTGKDHVFYVRNKESCSGGLPLALNDIQSLNFLSTV